MFEFLGEQHKGSHEFRILLMHGAGKGIESEFMQQVFSELTTLGLEVVMVDYPYMQTAKQLGKKRAPDRMPKLLDFTQQWMDKYSDKPIVLMGKSMGSRVAAQLSNLENVKAWAALGFPFIPPSQKDPEKIAARLAFLKDLKTPGLILQGTRDVFGKDDALLLPWLSASTTLSMLESADHDYKCLKSSGISQQEMIKQACQQLHDWLVTI